MLNEQLKKQIEQEAHRLYPLIGDVKKRIGYVKAGDKYASLWQVAEEKAAKYEKALKEIQEIGIDLITPHLPNGSIASQTVIEMDRLITDILTAKTGSDE